MSSPEILLMSGNPRGGKTTTGSLIRYLQGRLAPRGVEAGVFSLRKMEKERNKAQDGASPQEALVLAALDRGATLVLVFPIFLDAPPAQALAWMARVADARAASGVAQGQLVVVVLSGYPEPVQRLHARRVAEAFARESHLTWLGAIDFGSAPVIGGQDLKQAGFIARHIRRALESLAGDLASGRPLSPATEDAAARHGLPLPAFMAPWLMNFVMRRHYKEAGVTDVRARPYAPGE